MPAPDLASSLRAKRSDLAKTHAADCFVAQLVIRPATGRTGWLFNEAVNYFEQVPSKVWQYWPA
jgi:hypothetical protein